MLSFIVLAIITSLIFGNPIPQDPNEPVDNYYYSDYAESKMADVADSSSTAGKGRKSPPRGGTLFLNHF